MSILMAPSHFQLHEPIRYVHESYDTFSLIVKNLPVLIDF